MQIKVEKKALLEALTLSRGSVQTDNPVNTAYESVLFSVDPQGIWVHATDGSIWSSVLVEAQVRGGAPTMIKASQLTDIVSGLDDGELEVKFDGRQAVLKQGRYAANFGASNGMEFPVSPKLGDCKLVSVDAAKLVEVIRAVEGSADTRADRPYLNGVHFEVIDDDLEAVAADGSRLAHSELLGGFTGQTLVGTAGNRLASQWTSLAVLRPIDERISFGFHEGWGFMVGRDAIVCGLLPDQRFPNWRNAPGFPNPDDKSRVIWMDRKVLVRAVKRVVAIGAKLKGAVALDVESRADGALWLSAQASGKSSEERLDVKVIDRCLEGMFKRRVGGNLLFQAVSSMKSEEVSISIPTNDNKPIFISNVWENFGDVITTHYLMPRS